MQDGQAPVLCPDTIRPAPDGAAEKQKISPAEQRSSERIRTAHNAAAQRHAPSMLEHQLWIAACSSTSNASFPAQFMNSPQTLVIPSPLFPVHISPSEPERLSSGQDLLHSQEGLRSQDLERMPSLHRFQGIHSLLPADLSPPDSLPPAPSADWAAGAWNSGRMFARSASPHSSSRHGLAVRQGPSEMYDQQLDSTLPGSASWAADWQRAAPSMPNAQLFNNDAGVASPVISLSEIAGMLQPQEGFFLSDSPSYGGSASLESQALSEADGTSLPIACSPLHQSIAEKQSQHASASLRHVLQTLDSGLSASGAGNAAPGFWTEHTGGPCAHSMANTDQPWQPHAPQCPGKPADTGAGGSISAQSSLHNAAQSFVTRQGLHEAKSQPPKVFQTGNGQEWRNTPASTRKAGSNSAEGPNDRPDADHGGPAAYAAAVNSRIISSPEPGSVATHQEIRPSVVCPKEQCLLSLLHSLATPASAHSSGPLLDKGFTLRSINSIRGDVGRTPKYCAMYQQHIQVHPVCLVLHLTRSPESCVHQLEFPLEGDDHACSTRLKAVADIFVVPDNAQFPFVIDAEAITSIKRIFSLRFYAKAAIIMAFFIQACLILLPDTWKKDSCCTPL